MASPAAHNQTAWWRRANSFRRSLLDSLSPVSRARRSASELGLRACSAVLQLPAGPHRGMQYNWSRILFCRSHNRPCRPAGLRHRGGLRSRPWRCPRRWQDRRVEPDWIALGACTIRHAEHRKRGKQRGAFALNRAGAHSLHSRPLQYSSSELHSCDRTTIRSQADRARQ
jgi:hypothetical protein